MYLKNRYIFLLLMKLTSNLITTAAIYSYNFTLFMAPEKKGYQF